MFEKGSVYFASLLPTVVISDASPVGLGALLMQRGDDGEKLISCASRCLSETEQRYSQTEKEALGLVWACEHFSKYLYGINFELRTDHKPLCFIYGSRHDHRREWSDGS